MRLLLDENLPIALKTLLVGHDAKTVHDMGWIGTSNGELLRAAESAGFEVMLTADSNIRYQQSMAGRTIALVVLSQSKWQVVRTAVDRILQALEDVGAGDYREVMLERPNLRRRPAPGSEPS